MGSEDDWLRDSEIYLLELLLIVPLPARQLCCEPPHEATAECQPRPALFRHDFKIVSVRSWTLAVVCSMEYFAGAPVFTTCEAFTDINVKIPF